MIDWKKEGNENKFNRQLNFSYYHIIVMIEIILFLIKLIATLRATFSYGQEFFFDIHKIYCL